MTAPLGRPLRFAVAGAWNTAVGFGLFTMLQLTVGDRIGYLAVLAVSTVIAVVQAHLVQRLLVWRSRSPYLGELARFSTVHLFVYALNVLLLTAAVEMWHAPVLPSQYLIGGGLLVLAYVVQSRWTFRPPTPSPARAEAADQPTRLTVRETGIGLKDTQRD
jgi:putative flippase GtrA